MTLLFLQSMSFSIILWGFWGDSITLQIIVDVYYVDKQTDKSKVLL